jgi:hypothetical protein
MILQFGFHRMGAHSSLLLTHNLRLIIGLLPGGRVKKNPMPLDKGGW